MSNEIDWSRKLECDLGPVSPGMTKDNMFGRLQYVTLFDDITYVVEQISGTPIRNVALGDAFKVRNVKSNRDKAIEMMRGFPWGANEFHGNSAAFIDKLIEVNLLAED